MSRSVLNAGTTPWIPRTALSRATARSAMGEATIRNRTAQQELSRRDQLRPRTWVHRNATACSRSAAISNAYGMRFPSRCATGSSSAHIA